MRTHLICYDLPAYKARKGIKRKMSERVDRIGLRGNAVRQYEGDEKFRDSAHKTYGKEIAVIAILIHRALRMSMILDNAMMAVATMHQKSPLV